MGDLKPDGRPRAVLIAGPGAAATQTADLLGTLADMRQPRHPPRPHRRRARRGRPALGTAGLGRVSGPAADRHPGRHRTGPVPPRRAGLPARPHRRRRRPRFYTPLAESVSGSHGLFVPMAVAPYDHDEPLAASAPGVLWALLTPLLALLDRTGLLTAPPDTLQKVADRLDAVAERCGPAVVTYSNAAKTLAAELADSLPVVWTEGVSAGPAGRRFAAALAELSGTPAVVAELPEALAAHSALLAGPPPPTPTRTTSSATAWRRRPPCTPAWCCSATGPWAASPPPPPPASWPSPTTRRSASWNRRRAANWRPSRN